MIQTKPNLIIGLIIRAASLKVKEVENFKAEFHKINNGEIPWDYLGEN